MQLNETVAHIKYFIFFHITIKLIVAFSFFFASYNYENIIKQASDMKHVLLHLSICLQEEPYILNINLSNSESIKSIRKY